MVRVLLVLIPLALTIYAMIDAIQTDEARVKHLPKLIWIVLILVSSPMGAVGAIAWLFAGKQRGPQGGRQRPNLPRAPRGPDDDPDFLRNL